MSIHYLASGITVLLLIYHQLTTWLPLSPWNNVSKYTTKEVILEAGSNGLLMGAGAFCLLMGNSGFYHYYPLFYYPFLLSGEVFQWWLPYFSTKFAEKQVNFDYESRFAGTTKLIRHYPGKRTPDANHTILHALTVITLILVYIDRLGS